MISIIIPIFNADKTLEKCIDSLIKQTYKQIEIILVNDGSTDLSENIAKHYAEKFSNVLYCCQENKGVSAARNLGISKSHGDYIIFMDADDWAEPEYVQSLYETIEEGNSEFAFSNWYIDDGDNLVWDSLENYGYKFDKTPSSLIRFYMVHRDGCAPWAKMYRRDIIEKHNLKFNMKLPIAEDYIFLLNYLLYVDTISFDNSTYFHYMYNSNGANYKIRNNYPELQKIILEELGIINGISNGEYELEYVLATIIYNCRVILYLSKIRSQRADWKDIITQKSCEIREIIKHKHFLMILKLGRKELLVSVLSLLHLDILLRAVVFIKSIVKD